MADETMKKLLVKLGISTADWKKAVNEIKSELNKVNEQAKADAAKMQVMQKKQIELTKQQIVDQQRLQAEAKTLLSVDQAKAAWEKKNQEALKTKIQQKILETAEAKKQDILNKTSLTTEQANLKLQQQKLSIKKQEGDLAAKQAKEAQLASERLKREQLEAEERTRRLAAQQKISGIVAQTGQVSVPQLTAVQIAQQRQLLTEEKQRLALMEAELRVQGTQEGVKKEDLVLAQKQIADERAKLALQETELARAEQLLRVQTQQERVRAATLDRSAVAAIQQKIGFSPYTAPKMGGVLGAGGMFGPSTASVMREVAGEQERLRYMEAELRVMAQQETFRKVDIAEVSKIIVQERQRLTLLTMQLREQREQTLLGRITGGIGQVTGAIGGTLQRALGGGLFGGVAGGMITGMAGFAIFNQVVESIHKVTAALYEATGAERQLEAEFERLAARRGVDPSEMITKMRTATRGLMDDVQLFKMANGLLKSSMKISSDQMIELIQNTVNLGRSMGQSTPAIANALQRAFLNPQRGMMQLARVTGISVEQMRAALKGLPPTLDPASRATIMFNHILFEEEKMLRKVGVAATTLPELMEQLHVVQKNFFDAMARGMLTGGNLNATIADMSKRLLELQPKIEKFAETVGAKVGNAIIWVLNHLNEIKRALEILIGLKVASWAVRAGMAFYEWGVAAVALAKSLKLVQVAEEGVSAAKAASALAGIGRGTAAIAGAGIGEAAVGAGAGEAVAGGVTAAGIGTVALPVAAATAAVVGLQYAALREQGVSLTQTKEGFKELVYQIRDAVSLGIEELVKLVKAVPGIAKSLVSTFADIFLPGWKTIWDQLSPPVEKAWTTVKGYTKDLFDWVLEHSPFGQVAKQIKDLSEVSEGRKLLEHPKTVPGLSPEAKAEQVRVEKLRVGEAKSEVTDETEPNLALQRKLNQLRLQYSKELAKEQLEITKQRIAEERSKLQDSYELGLIDLKDYVDKQKTIHQEELNARLQEIKQMRAAEITALNQKRVQEIDGKQVTVLSDKEYNAQRAVIEEKYRVQEESARSKQQSDDRRADKTYLDDLVSARRTYTDTLNKITKEGVQERLVILESEFKEGRVGADQYIEERKNLIQEDYDATVTGLNDRLAISKQNAAELAKIQAALIQADIDREKQLTKLILDEDKVRLEALKNHYDDAKKYLETEMKMAEMTPGGGTAERRVATETLLNITDQYLKKLYDQQKALEDSGHAYDDTWIKITEQISQATEEQQKLNLELIKARDTSEPLARLFESVAGITQHIQSTGAQAVTETLNNLASSLKQISQFTIAAGQAPGRINPQTGRPYAPGEEGYGQPGANLFRQIGSQILGLFRHETRTTKPIALTAQQMFDKGLTDSKGKLTDLATSSMTASEQLQQLAAATQVAIAAEKQRMGLPAPGMPAPGEPGLGPVTAPPPGEFSIGGLIPPLPFATAPAETSTPEVGGLLPAPDISGLPAVTDETKAKLSEFGKALEDAKSPTKSFSDKLTDLVGVIGGAAQGIAGFVQAMTSAKSGGQGALGGGMAGMQLGANFGPWGAAIGGIGGAIFGGIFGAKEKELQRDIHKIQTQMEGILESLKAGTITLSQAITDLRREREAAIKMLAQDPKGGKGGGKGGKKGFGPTQAQAVIEQIDTKIKELVDEQKQILDSLHQSLVELSSPLQFQEYLQSLDQIIQKYQQFASAASGNAQEVAMANQYLNLSLQNYVQTLSQNLNQAQQTAIQDALTLINLEYQRQQLINQEAQQEYDILTQGVAVRQRTTAMTKGHEIGLLRYQRDMQLEQINEQIALNKHKVEAESKIFNLAKTRIGLETQLLAAQEEQADYQVKQIAALAQVVAALQGGLASGQLMQQISAMFAQGAMPTGTGLLYLLAQELGLGQFIPPGVTGGQYGIVNWLAKIPQPYQSAADYVNAVSPTFYTDLKAAAGTAVGSYQRQKVISDVQPLMEQGTVEGYDMQGLLNWLTNATIPAMAKGGMIKETGILLGHQGERVLNPEETDLLHGLIKSVTGVNIPPAIPAAVQSPSPSGLTSFVGNLGKTINSGMTSISSSINTLATGIVKPVGMAGYTAPDNSGMRLSVEGKLNDLAAMRASTEMQVISARHSLIRAEMEHLSALSATLDKINSTSIGIGNTDLEALLQKKYEIRGRMGSANFRRETV